MNQKSIIKNLRQQVLELKKRNKELNKNCKEFSKATVDSAKNLGKALGIQMKYGKFLNDMFGIEVVSSKKAEKIIKEGVPKGKFLELTENGYLGIDNTTGDVWTEDFDSLTKCVKWLQGEDLEEIEKEEEKVRHISDTCIKPDPKCDYCKDGKCKSKEHGFCIFRKIEGWRAC